jgi:hypothetical protein
MVSFNKPLMMMRIMMVSAVCYNAGSNSLNGSAVITHVIAKTCFCSPVVNFINILRPVFTPIFFCQKLQCQTVIREKLPKALLYEKVKSQKVLMKLTPEVFELKR